VWRITKESLEDFETFYWGAVGLQFHKIPQFAIFSFCMCSVMLAGRKCGLSKEGNPRYMFGFLHIAFILARTHTHTAFLPLVHKKTSVDPGKWHTGCAPPSNHWLLRNYNSNYHIYFTLYFTFFFQWLDSPLGA
jgi:hypothetical protein